ncbi:hypothetical protein GWI34_18425 [Actinomadura sp. DSM 109109]|nr:hypothetical protein [Actinomadura lepetitiana]
MGIKTKISRIGVEADSAYLARKKAAKMPGVAKVLSVSKAREIRSVHGSKPLFLFSVRVKMFK